jgi:hypothetical protein
MGHAATACVLFSTTLALGCAASSGQGVPDESDAGLGASDDASAGLEASGDSEVSADASEVSEASSPDGGSRCTIGPTAHDITCDHQTTAIGGRSVDYETPLGAPPSGGWPVVLLYQGSLYSPGGGTFLAPHGMWQTRANDAAAYGAAEAYVITELVTQTTILKSLLDAGYAVITPTADGGGFAWDTNFPPWSVSWSGSPDDVFLKSLFAQIDGGQLGALSATRWYATGVSSGGFMTSRMAVSYPGRFRSLVIAAGSYASCPGGVATCAIPPLPADHPATEFLQGGADVLVPESLMFAYYDALVAGGFTTAAKIDPSMLHGWLFSSPADVPAWFAAHP